MSSPAVNAFLQLDDNGKRQALSAMSPEAKQRLLAGIKGQPFPPEGMSPQSSATAASGMFIPSIHRPPDPILNAPQGPMDAIGRPVITAASQAGDVAKAAATPLPVQAWQGIKEGLKQHDQPQDPSLDRVAGALGINAKELGQAAAQGDIPQMVGETAIPVGMTLLGAKKAGPVGDEMLRRGAQETLNIGPHLTETALAENAPKLAEHAEAVKQVDALNQSRREALGQRAQLLNELSDNGTKMAVGLKELEKSVRERGGAMFDDIRSAVGSRPADKAVLRNAVEQGQKMLSGSPESIKIFKSILDDTAGGAVETSAGTATPGTPLYEALVQQGAVTPTQVDFANLHGYDTELGQKMASGNLPGDVYRALKTVREATHAEMQRMATEAGVGDQLPAARTYWARYEKTFHDMRPLARGGSPLARTLRAVDPDYAVQPLVGKAGPRGIAMLEQYDPEMAGMARETVAKYNQAQSLPKTANLKAMPEPPSPVDPAALKRQKLGEIAQYMRGSGSFRTAGDLLAVEEAARHGSPWPLAYPLGRRAIGMALQQPSIARWLTTPTAKELQMAAPPAPPQ